MNKSICLIAIANTDSYIFKKSLDSIVSYINNYLIYNQSNYAKDILDYFQAKNIPGNVVETSLTSLVDIRNFLFSLAKDKADYLLFIDLNYTYDFINKNFKSNLSANFYYLDFINSINILVKNTFDFNTFPTNSCCKLDCIINLIVPKIAIIILNYNMTEKIDNLVEKLNNSTGYPREIIVVDNGSTKEKSKYTSLSLTKNVQASRGWFLGYQYARAINNCEDYLAYCFTGSSIHIIENKFPKDIISGAAEIFLKDSSVAIVHPSMNANYDGYWNHFNFKPEKTFAQALLVEMNFMLIRGSFLDKIGGINIECKYGYGIDAELCYHARKQNKKIIVDYRYIVNKIVGIGYNFNRMGMTLQERQAISLDEICKYFNKKYGDNFSTLLLDSSFRQLTDYILIGDSDIYSLVTSG